jgi:hypothetical protein
MFFSSNSPNIAQVISAMDAIDEAFATGIINDNILSEPIRHALSIGKKTMNKYYALTDNSDIYRMAISKLLLNLVLYLFSFYFRVLHPRYKLNFFVQASWDQDWIDEAVRVTRQAWVSRYKPSLASVAVPVVQTVCAIIF